MSVREARAQVDLTALDIDPEGQPSIERDAQWARHVQALRDYVELLERGV